MNFLIITDYFAVGGSTTYITNVRKELEKNGHRVVLITFKSKAGSINCWHFKTDHHDIVIKDFHLRYYISRVFRLYQLLKWLFVSWKPDVVISDLYLPAATFLFCRPFFHCLHAVPFFYQFHGSNTLEKQSGIEYRSRGKHPVHELKTYIYISLLRFIERAVLNQATAIFILSEYSRTLLRALNITKTLYKITPGSERLFRNTYRSFSKKEARRACGVSYHKKIVLILSRLEPRKGVLRLLEALSSHTSFLTKFQVILCSQFDSYVGEEVLKNHGFHTFGTSVLLVNNPAMKNKALVYRAADVVLIPSLDLETFGFVALESYATGTPVVAYNTGALKELIHNKWLVDPVGDYEKLLRRVQQLLALPSRQRNAMPASLVRYSQKFSWVSYTNSLIQIAESYQKTS
jgi:glycosyltransferase involved in cell wall biosynthesis